MDEEGLGAEEGQGWAGAPQETGSPSRQLPVCRTGHTICCHPQAVFQMLNAGDINLLLCSKRPSLQSPRSPHPPTPVHPATPAQVLFRPMAPTAKTEAPEGNPRPRTQHQDKDTGLLSSAQPPSHLRVLRLRLTLPLPRPPSGHLGPEAHTHSTAASWHQ